METTTLDAMERAFIARKAANDGLPRVNNEDLPAGSDMHYYCRECGGEMREPEGHAYPAPTQCKLCKKLHEARLVQGALDSIS